MSTTNRTRVPSYRLHKPSGQAVVTLDGRDFYLGTWNSADSKQAYDRLVGEWQANGRRLPVSAAPKHCRSVNEVLLAYYTFAKGYYCKNGVPTTELRAIRESVKVLKQLYGRSPADEFGPLALKTCRESMIAANLSRGVINSRINRIKRVFKWAVENELVPPSSYHALQAIAGLKRGRSAARETPPVRPVPEEDVFAVFPFVSQQVRAMIELQLLTGMRPGEVRVMRSCDLDTTGRVWSYEPETHKTEHYGFGRKVYLGPKAQAVLVPFLRSELTAYLFDPRDAEKARNAQRRKKRRTPMTPSQEQRCSKGSPKRTAGCVYTKESYRTAIKRACNLAKVLAWHPHQLRHTAATRLRKQYGLETAQVILGHQTADVTQVYAERDQEKAREIMDRVG